MGTSEIRRKAIPHDDATIRKRRTAGSVSVIAGAPNLLASAVLFVLGVIGFLFLVYFLIALIFKDTGGDAFVGIIIVILIILVIGALIVMIIVLLLLLLLLIGMSGQVVGGILAYRGKRFSLSVTLLIVGSLISFMSGPAMFVGALVAGTDQIGLMVFFILWGIYDIISAIVTAVCTIVLIGCKDSFVVNTNGSNKGRSYPKRGRVK